MNEDSARKPPKRVQLDRYAVSVDRQRKAGFPDQISAERVAEEIRQKHPRVSVEVTDQESRGIVERPDSKGSESDDE